MLEATLLAAAQRATTNSPDRAYHFLEDGVTIGASLTFSDLDAHAQRLAVGLKTAGVAPGDRVLLLCEAGLGFVEAFFGCIYAGAVAVPIPAPHPSRLERQMPRFVAISKDAGVSAVVTSARLKGLAAGLLELSPDLASLPWLALEELANAEGDYTPPNLGPDDLVLLQYTSGSTGQPKGVMITNAAMVRNLAGIVDYTGGMNQRMVSWLPMFHDMGLIAFMLTAVVAESDLLFMSPIQFLQDPVKWMAAISENRGTVSAGPNFAFELLCRKSRPEQIATLDLSSLQVVWNAAEPVSAHTIRTFLERFGPAGLASSAATACYGLAENTVFVCGSRPGVTVRRVDVTALGEGRIVDASSGGAELVGCGFTNIDDTYAIVDDAGAPLPHDRVGEIWIHGESLGAGYWGHPDATEAGFGATLPGDDRRFMRTGDLGFLDAKGELFITGRLKEMIIVRGANHYPHDIERTVVEASPFLRRGGAAAFGVMVERQEEVVVAAEVDTRRHSDLPLADIAAAICASVGAEHEIALYAVVLLPAGAIPKTPSGKVQRLKCRKAFIGGEQGLHIWNRPADLGTPSPSGDLQSFVVAWLEARLGREVDPASTFAELGLDSLELVDLTDALREHLEDPTLPASLGIDHPSIPELCAHLEGATPPDEELDIEAFIVRWLSERLGREIDPTSSFAELGLDSLELVDLTDALRAHLDDPTLPASLGIDHPSIPELASHLRSLESAAATEPEPAEESTGDAVLSYFQEAVLAWERRSPRTCTWTHTLRARADLDPDVLQRALRRLARRQVGVLQGFDLERGLVPLRIEDLVVQRQAVPSADALEDAYLELARRAFPLDGGPLIEVHLLEHAGERQLVAVWHQLLLEGTASGLLLGQLLDAYQNELDGLPDRPFEGRSGVEHARWERQTYTTRGWADVLVVRRRIEGASPFAHPDRRDGYDPSTIHVRTAALLGDEADPIRHLVDQEGATLFSAMAALLGQALHRWTGQQDLTIGSPALTRTRSEIAHTLARFGSWVPIRMKLDADADWASVHQQVRAQSKAFVDPVPAALVFDDVDVLGHPLMRVILNTPSSFHRAPGRSVAGSPVEPLRTMKPARCGVDLNVVAGLGAKGLGLEVTADAGRYDQIHVDALTEHLLAVIAELS